MTYRTEMTTVAWYTGMVAIIFVAAYVVFGVREMALYLVLMLVNLPASVVVVPYMESFSLGRGWTLGHPLHVWTTQLVCMAVNGVLIGTVAIVVVRSWRLFRGHGDAV